MSDRLLTVLEVADWLRISPSKIYALAAAKRITSIRIDSSLRFEPEAVRRFIENCAQPVQAEAAQ